MSCPTCNQWMSKVANLKEAHGIPATPDWIDFECELCNQKWRHGRVTNLMARV